MFQRMIDDVKEQAGSTLRQFSLAAAAAVALFITTLFLCAALFVAVLEKYGPTQACLAGAAVFFVVAVIAAGSYIARKSQIKARDEKRAALRAKDSARSALHSLADPMVVTTSLQVIRAIGLKRLIPILAVGGLALGLLVSRGSSSGAEEPAE